MDTPYLGKLIIISGASGSGKNTLVRYVRTRHSEFVFPRTCTTRTRREGESEEAYFFLTRDAFEKKITEGYFLEWATYGNNLYGTPKTEVLPQLQTGKTVLLIIEIQGAHAVHQLLPREVVATVFIDAGSWDALVARIQNRAHITDAELAKRKERYEKEIAYRDAEAQFVVQNFDGRLEDAKIQFEHIITSIASAATHI